MPVFTGSIENYGRNTVIAGLVSVIALSWAYMIFLDRQMNNMEMVMEIPGLQFWSGSVFIYTFFMWAVMMVAMMTPSAMPMIIMFASLNHQRQQKTLLNTSLFLIGYLVSWFGFSIIATLAQWGLHDLMLLSPMLVISSPYLAGTLLVIVGVFQFSAFKNTCLTHCRTPMGFFMNEWRDGKSGAFYMGLKHGSYCVGCCWLLMALLFIAGVMNLLWVATIAIYVLLEKVIPQGHRLSQLIGVFAVVWGVWLILGTN